MPGWHGEALADFLMACSACDAIGGIGHHYFEAPKTCDTCLHHVKSVSLLCILRHCLDSPCSYKMPGGLATIRNHGAAKAMSCRLMRHCGMVQGHGPPSNCCHGSKTLLALLCTAEQHIISREANDTVQRGRFICCPQCNEAHSCVPPMCTLLPVYGLATELVTCLRAVCREIHQVCGRLARGARRCEA